jgi:hypothetical protein
MAYCFQVHGNLVVALGEPPVCLGRTAHEQSEQSVRPVRIVMAGGKVDRSVSPSWAYGLIGDSWPNPQT